MDVVRPAAAVEAVRTALSQEPLGAYGLTISDSEGLEVDLVPGDRLSSEPETSDWTVVFGATASYPTTSGSQATALASEVAGMSDDAGIPLLVDVRRDGVTIDSRKDRWDDDERSDGSRFELLAARIQAAAHALGLGADAERPRFVQLGIDAVDVRAVRAFWSSVLDYEFDERGTVTDIYDPHRLNPVLFFQPMDPADEERIRGSNRIHLELHLSAEAARRKSAAVLQAGGRALPGGSAGRRAFADPEGNELTLITTTQRP